MEDFSCGITPPLFLSLSKFPTLIRYALSVKGQGPGQGWKLFPFVVELGQLINQSINLG